MRLRGCAKSLNGYFGAKNLKTWVPFSKKKKQQLTSLDTHIGDAGISDLILLISSYAGLILQPESIACRVNG